jgi:hypothetical protein
MNTTDHPTDCTNTAAVRGAGSDPGVKLLGV